MLQLSGHILPTCNQLPKALARMLGARLQPDPWTWLCDRRCLFIHSYRRVALFAFHTPAPLALLPRSGMLRSVCSFTNHGRPEFALCAISLATWRQFGPGAMRLLCEASRISSSNQDTSAVPDSPMCTANCVWCSAAALKSCLQMTGVCSLLACVQQ
jgi:hypothetical protein